MQQSLGWLKAIIKVEIVRNLTKAWAIGFSLLLTSCATPVDRYVTASGLPEVIIHAPTTKVKPRIISGYQQGGWTVSGDSAYATKFIRPCGATLGCALGQALIGNQYSTAPNLEITLSWIQLEDRTKVIMSDLSMTTQMAFGQIQRQSLLGNNQTFNREVDSLNSWKLALEESFGGIGISGQYIGDLFVVQSIVEGGPADLQSELAVGEVILSVAQGAGAFENVQGKSTTYLIGRLRGEVGSVVRLKVAPSAHSAPAPHAREIEITRDLITPVQ